MRNKIGFLTSAMVVLLPIYGFAADYNLRLQSSDYVGEKNFNIQRQWLDDVEKASNGRLSFDLLPQKGVVDGNETLDAMRLGLLDGHLTSTAYFGFKDPAIALMGNTVGAWSDTDDLIDYLYKGGGNELMAKLYEPYGVKYVGGAVSGVEAFVSKVPLNGVADLQGLKLRSPDALVTKVFQAAGAKPLELPGSQVIDALNSGIIDAADYSVFSTNQAAGMNDIAPNPVYPGFHSAPLFDFSLSQDTWDRLPRDLQNLLMKSARDLADLYASELAKADEVALEEAAKNPAITIHNWSDAERKKFRTIAQEQWKIVSEQSPNAKLAYDSLTQYMRSKNLL